MKNFKLTGSILLGILLIAGCFSFSHAQIDRPERPEHIEFPEVNPIQVPEVHRFTHRGVEFFLVEDPELPLISMSVRIKAGSWLEADDKIGLASITGEVMRSGGTVNYPSDEFNEILESRAASMETSFGLTSGTASMNLLTEDFDEMLPLFIELLTQPAFPQEKLDLAITQRRSGISRRNDNPSGIAAREFGNIIYGKNTVYNRTLEYEHLSNIELQDLIDFHQQAVVAENLMVGISGDFSIREIRRKLVEAFDAIPSGTPNEFEFPEIDYEFKSSISFVERPEMNQSIIRIGHIGGFRDNPDYAALQVMNQILSGGFSGRLMQEVRTRQGLAYGVSGSYSSNVLYPGLFFAGLSTAGDNTAKAINATLHEIHRLQSEEVPQEELDDTRERFLNSLVFRYENRASALFEQLNNTYLGLPLDAFEQYVEEVREVTVEDIHRVAREYLRPDDVQILVVGNPDLVGDQLDEFGDVQRVDITIPRPAPRTVEGEEAGDLEAGAEWLNRMSNELIGDTEFSSITLVGTFVQGGMNMDTDVTFTFPHSMRQVINTPMGQQTLVYENGTAKVVGGGGEQQLPPQFAEEFRKSLQRHYLNLALTVSEQIAEYRGNEVVDDTETAKLYLPEHDSYFYLSLETGLPVKVTYEEFNPQTGSDSLVEILYSNWNEAGGVKAAWEQVQKVEGNVQGSSSFTEHSIE